MCESGIQVYIGAIHKLSPVLNWQGGGFKNSYFIQSFDCFILNAHYLFLYRAAISKCTGWLWWRSDPKSASRLPPPAGSGLAEPWPLELHKAAASRRAATARSAACWLPPPPHPPPPLIRLELAGEPQSLTGRRATNNMKTHLWSSTGRGVRCPPSHLRDYPDPMSKRLSVWSRGEMSPFDWVTGPHPSSWGCRGEESCRKPRTGPGPR